jgi:4-hydroxy-tetrahydrodipicolinate synthase
LKIDFTSLSKLIDFYIRSGAKGFFANCLSSEMYALTNEERLSLVRHVVKQVNGSFPVVASGSFGQTIEERVEFTKRMYDTGVNAVILITSHFAEKADSDDILIKNFEKFFSLANNIPVGTYECPSPYKRILTPPVFKYLLSTNKLIYHKDTTLDIEKIKEKLQLAKGSRLELYDAHTPNAMYSLQAGAKGISAIAGNFYPEIYAWLCANVNNPAKQNDVKWIQSEITKKDPLISDSYPMSAKYFLQKRGVPMQVLCRTSPTLLTPSQKENLDKLYNDIQKWHERLKIQV